MALKVNTETGHRRASSGSTVKASAGSQRNILGDHDVAPVFSTVQATLWIHDDPFSSEEVLINESILEGTDINEGDLIEIYAPRETSDVRDFTSPTSEHDSKKQASRHGLESSAAANKGARYLCIAKFASPDFKAKQPNLQISVKSNIATAFGLRSRSQVVVSLTSFDDCTASHVELGFRDAYLARSDMWRLVGQELAGKTVFTGQRITFLGTIRLTVKSIHVNGHKAATAYFSGSTIPVFRSEAARYVLFIQMSSEMWDFDSEGNGEIMFNRVINGFLPELFKRWTDLEVRHLVSIVLFGRLEYDRFDLARNKDRRAETSALSNVPQHATKQYQDFYRVVVTDMASAQWTTILDELKKDFRVFLRDISMHTNATSDFDPKDKPPPIRIAGRPSAATKGNILEAINLACSQFSNDYVDRDLIRTGVSVVVITAGTGVFEVNRDLLNLTSETLTNNGVGIDIVCLSRMPLHSVPLLKYRNTTADEPASPLVGHHHGPSPRKLETDLKFFSSSQPRKLSPALSSIASNSTQYLASYVSTQTRDNPQGWCYGIPQWIDLSYWAPQPSSHEMTVRGDGANESANHSGKKGPFVSRVRMYEIQMMGIMELGMADISIPWINETQNLASRRIERRKSKGRHASDSRSLSHSPTLSRRGRAASEMMHINRGLLSAQAKANGDVFNRMDDYDKGIFAGRSQNREQLKSSKIAAGNLDRPSELSVPTESVATPVKQMSLPKATAQNSAKGLNSLFRPRLPSIASADPNHIPQMKDRTPERPKVNRNFSLALRGLAPTVRAMASTSINATNAQAQPSFGNLGYSKQTIAASAASIRSVSVQSNPGDRDLEDAQSKEDWSSMRATLLEDTPSKPISITTPLRKRLEENYGTPERIAVDLLNSHHDSGTSRIEHNEEKETVTHSVASSRSDESGHESEMGSQDGSWPAVSVASSVPQSTLPFVRNVNASNPLKRHPERESNFGKWQHLYPRKPRESTVKWRSLCTPASVPLTTADFPSKHDLETEYDTAQYTVKLQLGDDLPEIPESRDTLLREMLALRFAHGYQLVVGPRLVDAVGPGTCDASAFFTPNLVRPDGVFIFLSMGNTIQKLSLHDADQIHVTRYQRSPRAVQPPFPSALMYRPNIKTILSGDYKVRDMQLTGFAERYPWEKADNFLADATHQDVDFKSLRFWRARFVLIPVEPPASARRTAAMENEENEEEIHLRGIRALTQMWQKARWIPPDERRPSHNRMSTVKPKDKNPLRINLETLNPSELVATELDKLSAAEEAGDGQATQLLPEAEQFDRESYKTADVAQAMQGDRGVEIRTRRWHLRLHYSCFHGEEFTNWLVHNFRDIDTREEAVELGNELMNEHLFEHVNGKYKFKDGNYFYSIKDKYRVLRPDLKSSSWFSSSRRSDKSIPPTPLAERPRDMFSSPRSRSGSNLAAQAQMTSELSRNLDPRKRRSVTLSKMIRIDVDVRKRSSHPEVINLHYDRLHNPENCYHLELTWLNVTSKLVDDAIVSWTTLADKYGLKLVEVPIAEACKVPENEPFRAAYRVALSLQPPPHPASTFYFTATSFGPQQPPNTDRHIYQKALLKRFNFVLDLEAISEFPADVDIKYSWGPLDYQYTQFVHRSGVLLAQITDEGDIILLANRLYNSRLSGAKETSKSTAKKDLTPNSSMVFLRPAISTTGATMQASGIIGVNLQSPQNQPHASPAIRPSNNPIAATASISTSVYESGISTGELSRGSGAAVDANGTTMGITADVLPNRRIVATASGFNHFVTPEQIKDELEAFCSDPDLLEAFYREVTAMLPTPSPATDLAGSVGMGMSMSMSMSIGSKRRSGGAGGTTSSSMLRPVHENDTAIPEFRLPEAVGSFMGLSLTRTRKTD